MKHGDVSAAKLSSQRELVYIVRQEISVPMAELMDLSFMGDAATALLNRYHAVHFPLFHSLIHERLGLPSIASIVTSAGFSLAQFMAVTAEDQFLEELAAEFLNIPGVLAAYLKPAAELPRATATSSGILNTMPPSRLPAPAITPDFSPQQGYLNAAPGGVDARYAWAINGGDGTGVNIIDVEGDWRFSHEDLTHNLGGLVGGQVKNDVDWRSHGTSVLGEIKGDRNAFGVVGICPEAYLRTVSIFGWPFGASTSAAIAQAAAVLSPGDILLIEMQRAGPRFNFRSRGDEKGCIPVEWWPDDFAAIQYALSRGILVVEPAGNGAENLDDPIYNSPQSGFPGTWKNPFDRRKADSGAIVVGAGSPPSGNFGPDRSRLDFSNFGSAVDTQGWGHEVTTCGYGDLQGGDNEDKWYTDQFSGTSSATPMIVGVLGCLQGIQRARGKKSLTPNEARYLLRTTGSAQQVDPAHPTAERIGNRPDLRQLIDTL